MIQDTIGLLSQKGLESILGEGVGKDKANFKLILSQVFKGKQHYLQISPLFKHTKQTLLFYTQIVTMEGAQSCILNFNGQIIYGGVQKIGKSQV